MGIVIYPKHKGKRGQRDMEEFVKGTISYMEMVFKRLPKKWTHEDFSKVAQEVSDEYYTRSSLDLSHKVSARRHDKRSRCLGPPRSGWLP